MAEGLGFCRGGLLVQDFRFRKVTRSLGSLRLRCQTLALRVAPTPGHCVSKTSRARRRRAEKPITPASAGRLPFAYLPDPDPVGWVWASLLTGQPGGS